MLASTVSPTRSHPNSNAFVTGTTPAKGTTSVHREPRRVVPNAAPCVKPRISSRPAGCALAHPATEGPAFSRPRSMPDSSANPVGLSRSADTKPFICRLTHIPNCAILRAKVRFSVRRFLSFLRTRAPRPNPYRFSTPLLSWFYKSIFLQLLCFLIDTKPPVCAPVPFSVEWPNTPLLIVCSYTLRLPLSSPFGVFISDPKWS